MPTSGIFTAMPLGARRTFRLSLTTAIALVIAYALQLPLPFLAPLFAILLTLKPAPPIGIKGLLKVILAVVITLSSGLLVTPLLVHYDILGVMLVGIGIYFSTYLSLARENAAIIGTLLTLGITLISAAGVASSALSIMVIQGIAIGIVIATISQWLVYPFFPEDQPAGVQPVPADAWKSDFNWIALRTTLIVMPVYLLVLTNPSAYMPLMMKSTILAQQASLAHAKSAGKELLIATLLAGLLAVLIWFGLKLAVNLWMFFLWISLCGLYIAAKFYRVLPSRFGPVFWQDVFVTLLIILGPAVQDSANGKDVYAAFFVRMGLFIALTLYAWLAVYAMEQLRTWRQQTGMPATVDEDFI